jgi:hypothetical protein
VSANKIASGRDRASRGSGSSLFAAGDGCPARTRASKFSPGGSPLVRGVKGNLRQEAFKVAPARRFLNAIDWGYVGYVGFVLAFGITVFAVTYIALERAG